MNIEKILLSQCIEISSQREDKDSILKKISNLAKQNPTLNNITEEEIYKALKDREDMGSTAISSRIAIPHCRMEEVDNFVLGLYISKEGIDFDAIDKKDTFVLDFFNEPEEILAAFQPYYQTAELDDVSNPDLIFDLFDKLRASGIFTWQEVEQFCEAFLQKSKSNAAISNICKPAVERWQKRYKLAIEAYRESKDIFERTKKTGDAVLTANAENSFKECKEEKDALEIFKKDLGTFVRFYEFMSQIVDYDDKNLEKLGLYARNLRPMLRESMLDEDDIDLDNVVLHQYRLSKIRQQDIKLKEDAEEHLVPGDALGTAKAKDPKEEFLSQIISRLNELFIMDNPTDDDLVNYANTIRDKVRENKLVMSQIANNTPEQAMLGDFNKAVDDAIMDSSEAHQNQMMQILSDPTKANSFARVVFDLLKMAD